ncbi:MAG: TIGR02996 domain-containing protein [Myxococcota bacterium]|nr:TIGR02996 domain-containing protein [Myxococcota bacterium]
MTLAFAIAAARAGAFDEGLAHLLAAWRETRAPELAALIEQVSARASRPPITGHSQRALHAAWLAVRAANDPLDLDRLLATLAHGNLTMARERIASFATLPPDPRVAARFEAMIASPPSVAFVKSSSLAMWNAVFAELGRIADPRTRTIHERLAWLAHDRAPSPFDAGTLRARTVNAIALVAQAIAPPLDLSPAQRAQHDELAAILRTTPTPAARGAALLAKIYEEPHDLDARAVYGDWLTEQGDPRGELIALQLARDLMSHELDVSYSQHPLPARERVLLRTHQSVWVGPLGALLSDIVFERGFPYRGVLARQVPLAALAIPEISTLASLGAFTNEAADGRLLATRAFHGLRAVIGIGWVAFEGLATAPTTPAIRAVRISRHTDEELLPSRFEGLSSTWPLERLHLQTSREPPETERVLAFMRMPLVRRLQALRTSNDRPQAFVQGFIESEIARLEFVTVSSTFDLWIDRDDSGAPRVRIVVRFDDRPYRRGTSVPQMRALAESWPRDLVDVALLEIDPALATHAPDEREQILAAAKAFAAGLEVTETKNAAR